MAQSNTDLRNGTAQRIAFSMKAIAICVFVGAWVLTNETRGDLTRYTGTLNERPITVGMESLPDGSVRGFFSKSDDIDRQFIFKGKSTGGLLLLRIAQGGKPVGIAELKASDTSDSSGWQGVMRFADATTLPLSFSAASSGDTAASDRAKPDTPLAETPVLIVKKPAPTAPPRFVLAEFPFLILKKPTPTAPPRIVWLDPESPAKSDAASAETTRDETIHWLTQKLQGHESSVSYTATYSDGKQDYAYGVDTINHFAVSGDVLFIGVTRLGLHRHPTADTTSR